MTDTLPTEVAAEPALPPAAGAQLRAAREAAGLSIDAVAQQLKLAPRQVRALEEGDHAQLPGRTFIRGFMRNYARLVRLDPTVVLDALPETSVPASLERVTLGGASRGMVELPSDSGRKPGAARWAIPLVLIAIVGIAAVYEFTRPPNETPRASAKAPASPPAATVAAPVAPPVDRAGSAPEGSPLPNPLAAPATPPEAGSTAAPPTGTDAMPASAPTSSAGMVVLSFRGTSWAEVKDAKGVSVLSVTGLPGATHGVSGEAPFEVIIGNAEAVTVTFRGQPFDLAPHARQNVARFTLK